MSKQLTDKAREAIKAQNLTQDGERGGTLGASEGTPPDGPSHGEKANALAEKITKKAEDTLHRLEREMLIMKWPADFRAIMWGAVAAVASQRADEARNTLR